MGSNPSSPYSTHSETRPRETTESVNVDQQWRKGSKNKDRSKEDKRKYGKKGRLKERRMEGRKVRAARDAIALYRPINVTAKNGCKMKWNTVKSACLTCIIEKTMCKNLQDQYP